MIKLSGRTFDHKDRLRELGGIWNSDTKQWNFYSLTPEQKLELRNLPGCSFVDGENEVGPIEPSQSDIDKVLEMLGAVSDDDKEKPTKREGKTILYGDDDRYFNYFKDRNPFSFFGFSSLNEMLKFVARIPPEKRTGRRNAGYDTSDPKWSGSRDMPEAINLARNGWSEGADKAAEIIEMLNIEHAINKQRKYSVAGGSVNVGRLLSGNPLHMSKRAKQPGKRNITLFVENVASAYVKPETLIVRASVIGAIVDILESNGYSCEIISTVNQIHNGKAAAQTAVTVKSSGEKLNINDLVFTLGHPSFLRRLVFACVSQANELEMIYRSQGQPSPSFNALHRPPGRNEFNIPGISKNTTNIDEIMKLVIPQGLPITIGKES